ncbi:MAG: type II toxin-antitoxin system HicA family toxin [Anaerolineae bacterium]|nr:type II toxin-antitoxin system HicA family toxin [Anaerolineae bacterium]
MTKKEKLLRRLRNNPTDVSFQDLETLLFRFGFQFIRANGSHHLYEYEQKDIWRQVIIPVHGRKIKSVYVKKVIEIIDELLSLGLDEIQTESEELESDDVE